MTADHYRPRIRPPGFDYVPGRVSKCFGPGLAVHDIDAEHAFNGAYRAHQGETEVWVDQQSGRDDNDGTLNRPLRTIAAAMTQTPSLGCIWLKPGVYTDRFDVRASQNLVGDGSVARAVHIKAWGAPGSVVFRAPGAQPRELVWLRGDSSSAPYEALPPGRENASHVIMISQGVEVQLEWCEAASHLCKVDAGWHQDPKTKVISVKYHGHDFTDKKMSECLEIMYEREADNLVYGAKIYLENIDFRGTNQLTVQCQNVIRPVVYGKGCRFQYLGYHNFHVEGGRILLQRCTSERSLNGDGFNYYDDDRGVYQSEVTEIDCISRLNGTREYRKFDGDRNKQGSSGHHKARICRINGVYEGNFGQNIADTGSQSKTWMIGSVLGNPAEIVASGSDGSGYYNLWTEGDVWLDNVKASGNLSSYGLWIERGIVKSNRCEFFGYEKNVGGNGIKLSYAPDEPYK